MTRLSFFPTDEPDSNPTLRLDCFFLFLFNGCNGTVHQPRRTFGKDTKRGSRLSYYEYRGPCLGWMFQISLDKTYRVKSLCLAA